MFYIFLNIVLWINVQLFYVVENQLVFYYNYGVLCTYKTRRKI